MKTLYLSAILLLIAAASKAQIINTKWEGSMYVPTDTKVILNFKKDSVDMIIVDAGIVGETMTYSVTDSVITLKKTSGNSPCNIGDTFKIKYSIRNDKLFISNITDPCDERGQSWTKEPFARVKN